MSDKGIESCVTEITEFLSSFISKPFITNNYYLYKKELLKESKKWIKYLESTYIVKIELKNDTQEIVIRGKNDNVDNVFDILKTKVEENTKLVNLEFPIKNPILRKVIKCKGCILLKEHGLKYRVKEFNKKSGVWILLVPEKQVEKARAETCQFFSDVHKEIHN